MKEINPNWPFCQIQEPSKVTLQKWKTTLFNARDVKSQVLYAVFNVKPPPPEALAKQKTKMMGKPMTIAQNFDKSQARWLKSLIKDGVVQCETVKQRIEQSQQYRSVLANNIINANSFPNPAQYLLSDHCRYALRVSRQKGELAYPAPQPPYEPAVFKD